MFGGLSVKGASKDEESASSAPAPAPAGGGSGFSFLQSSIGGAPSTPTPTPAASASSAAPEASHVEAEAPAAAAGMGGSAFGFLSSTPAPAPVAAPASPAPAAGASESQPPPAGGGGSAFGFLSGAGGGDAGAEEAPSEAAPPSMFAGLTTSDAKEPAAPTAAEPAAAAPGSGFSFLSAPAPAADADSAAANNLEAASTTTTAGSSFGFLSSMAGSTEHEGESTAQEEGGAAGQDKEEEGGTSGFSFLGAAPAPPAPDAAPPAPTPPATAATESSAPAPGGGDLLSASNPTMPAGAGVSWSAPSTFGGATAKKKVVKKKRGKRVGVGSAAAAASIPEPAPAALPEPPPSSFQPPTVPGADAPSGPPQPNWGTPNANAIPAPPSTPGPAPATLPESPPMRIKAERAMDKAEEFIREKQRKSAIALAAERAMLDKNNGSEGAEGTDGGGGGWKVSNSNGSELSSSPRDETYMAAKAAAQEAKKLADHPPNKGKHSLFGNLFGRNKGGGSNSSIPSRSSHGGVVGSPVPVGKATFQRGGSSGSAASGGAPATPGGLQHSPLPATKELREIEASYGSSPPSYGSPRPEDAAAKDEEKRKEREFEAERHRLELEHKQREAEAAQRRQEEERKRREEADRHAELRERERKMEEERERRRAPREKMQTVLDHLADAARTSTDVVAALRDRRVGLVRERSAAEKAERYAAQQLKFAEAQQTLAAEAEDFEEADRLGTVIATHSTEREGHAEVCARMSDAIAKLDEEREEASRAVAACFAEAFAKLEGLERDVDDRAKEEGVLSQFESTSKRLSSETERLASDLKHIERDEEVLQEEQKELDGQIGEETKEVDEKRAVASTKLEDVNKTIADLRAKLMEAEATAFELTTEIKSYDQSIQTVKSKYSRQIGRLEKKEQSVKESRADWESERESIEKAKAAHEAVVAAHSEDMVSKEKLLEDIKAESSAAKDFEGIVSTSFADIAALSGEGTAVDSEVLKYEAAVSEANQNVLAAETNIQNLQEELATIEVRVPILESEKKMAASKRDFKAAGKASKEIKDALARKEQCQAELSGEAMERKQFAKDELAKITTMLEEKKAAAAEKGREAGLERMGLLREKIDELKALLKKFATENGNSSEDDSINVSLVGAFVLEGQIGVLEEEGRSLGEKWGGWDTPDDSSVQSAPSLSSEEDGNDSGIDTSALESYMSLRKEMKELNAAIEEAAEKEDFDKADELAAQLEEKVKSIGGFSIDDLEAALKNRASAVDEKKSEEVVDVTKGEDEGSSEILIDEGVLERYASHCKSVTEYEADIESAVAGEDYDKAAELEEKVQSVRAEIESLGFSVDALEEALKARAEASSPSTTAVVEGSEEGDELVKGTDDASPPTENGSEGGKGEKEDDDSFATAGEEDPTDEGAKMNGNADAIDNEEGAVDNTDDTAAESNPGEES